MFKMFSIIKEAWDAAASQSGQNNVSLSPNAAEKVPELVPSVNIIPDSGSFAGGGITYVQNDTGLGDCIFVDIAVPEGMD